MKNVILICLLLISNIVLCQYPTWVPDQFKNKVFCGEFKVSGQMFMGYGGYQTVYNKVKYELTVSETGIQLKINPGDQFRDDRWGETIKVKYKTSKIQQYDNGVSYFLDLTDINETDDSPVFPKYKILSIDFYVSSYNGSLPKTREEIRKWVKPGETNLNFEVAVPHYEDGRGRINGGFMAEKATVCGEVESSLELKNKLNKIKDFISKKDYLNAKKLYNELNKPNDELLSKIDNIKKEKQQEIISLIASNQLTLALEKCDGLDETTDEINRLIVPRLTERYRDTLIYIEKEKAINLIKNNFESKVAGLKDGTYKLVISNTGNLSIYQNLNIIISNQLKMDEVRKLKIHSFEIPVNSEFIFEITSTTINLSVKDYTSTIDFDTEKNPSVAYLKNQDIPKGKFWKMQVVQNDKNIGDVRLSSSESLKFISEHKLKKNHIIRNAIIFGVIYIGYYVVIY